MKNRQQSFHLIYLDSIHEKLFDYNNHMLLDRHLNIQFGERKNRDLRNIVSSKILQWKILE